MKKEDFCQDPRALVKHLEPVTGPCCNKNGKNNKKVVIIITVENYDGIYDQKTDQTKLLCIYFFLIQKWFSFLEKFLVKLQTTFLN